MKWAKYALIAVAPIILAAGLWSMLSSRPSLPSTYPYVDVMTGEIVKLGKGEIVSIPAPNKRDGELTMFPVDTDELGRYIIAERYVEDFQAFAKKQTQPIKVDVKTLLVEGQPSQ
jgi:hypothetical protein